MKNKHIFIPLFVFIGACVISLAYSIIDFKVINKQPSYSYETIQFNYDGASDGKDPNGNPFDAVSFLTDDILSEAMTHSQQKRGQASVCRPPARLRPGSSTPDGSAQHRRSHVTCAPLSLVSSTPEAPPYPTADGPCHSIQHRAALREAASPGGTEDKVAGQRFSCSRAG